MSKVTQIDFKESSHEVSIPVAVVLERTIDNSKKWVMPQWKIFAVVVGEHIHQHDQSVLIHEHNRHSRFFWGGLVLHLYKDGTEGYWYNLLSDTPFLFVICDGEEGDEYVEPTFITANQDEATGYMESNHMVLSIDMPAEICDILEHFVISHYRPEQRKKRKRQEWVSESAYAKKLGNRSGQEI